MESKDNPEAKDTCIVTILPAIMETTGIEIVYPEYALLIGDSVQLDVKLAAKYAKKGYTLSSSDAKVALLDDSLYVHAVAAGECFIVAVSNTNPNVRDTMKLTVVEAGNIPVTGISLLYSTIRGEVGDSLQLTPIIYPFTTTNRKLTLVSTDMKIAHIDEDFVVHALAPGRCKIIATSLSNPLIADTCEVIIVPASNVKVDAIALNYMQKNVYIGDTLHLTATALPANKPLDSYFVHNFNESVATIDENLVIHAKAEGTCVIVVSSASNPDVLAACQITVTKKPIPVTSLELLTHLAILEKGGSFVLHAEIGPVNADDLTVEVSTTDDKIATIEAGKVIKVTAVGIGTCKIIVSSLSTPEVKDTCDVIVVEAYTAVASVALPATSLSLVAGTSKTLVATVLPAEANNRTVKYMSSDLTIATVNEAGVIKALKVGSCDITAVSNADETKMAVCKVTVTAEEVAVVSLSLNKTTAAMKIGESLPLTATVTPTTATNTDVEYSSSDSKIASVDAQGNIKALAAGTATITATSKANAKATANCVVTVSALPIAVKTITVDQPTASMKAGATLSVVVSVLPADATDKSLKYSSSDEKVATVGADGKITAIAKGNAVITIENLASGIKATVTLEVTPATSIDGIDAELVTVYPNPTADYLFVKGLQPTKLELISTSGAVIVSTKDSEINISGYATGTYILNIYAGNAIVSKTITKK